MLGPGVSTMPRAIKAKVTRVVVSGMAKRSCDVERLEHGSERPTIGIAAGAAMQPFDGFGQRPEAPGRNRRRCQRLSPASGLGGNMTLFSRLLYTIISFALLGASIILIGVAVWRTSNGFWTGDGALDTMLD